MGNELSLIKELLKQRSGLDAEALGTAALERAVRQRAADRGCADLARYWSVLHASPTELQELIEAVVVPETWFLRDPESFAALGRLAVERLGAGDRGGDAGLRLLSLPCATGEEPYSMALTLLDAGVAPARFIIDAVDISGHALALARRAEYGRNAFRGIDPLLRDRHFTGAGERWRPSDAVRGQVRLRHGNLLGGDPLPGEPPYDIVFCRNVLIYFDRPTQQRALAMLKRLLKPDGLLFVGPSETALLLRDDFHSLKLPLAFAFRRGPAAAAAPPVVPRATALPPRPRPAGPPPRVPPRPAPPPAARAIHPPAADPLAAAARLADAGRFDEAERLCGEHLRAQPESAAALHLLGLVHDARGDVERAGDCYRKALYLDPQHREALLHLALLLEQQGRFDEAQRLHSRAARCRESGTA